VKKYFVGKHPLNNVPMGNGKVLVFLQQYAQRKFAEPDMEQFIMRKPADKISHILYPYYSKDFSVLGDSGIYVSVKDTEEKIWYDFYATWDSPLTYEKSAGYLSIDKTKFVDGTGIYEVISHKGYNVVKTTTWVPQDTDALVRRIEVSSYLKDRRKIDIYPQIHLKGEIIPKNDIIVSRVVNQEGEAFLAITCYQFKEWHGGDFQSGVKNGFNNTISPGMKEITERANLSFRVERDILPGEWSEPVHLVIGFGRTEEEAINNLNQVISSPSFLYENTLAWWNKWLTSGTMIKTSDQYLDYLWRVSKTLLKMSIQHNGLMVIIGYLAYQGCVWIRDNVLVAMALSQAGHLKESLQILYGLKNIIKKRKDGNFSFIYDCWTGKAKDFTYEIDSTGLLLAAIWCYYQHSGDLENIRDFWEIVEHSAEWICNHRDDTGMIIPSVGIWEDFCPSRAKAYEHMVWTSGVSAYGLSKAAVIADKLNKKDKSLKYMKVYKELLRSIRKNCIKDGILYRSPEIDHLDSSVLTFFTWMPIFNDKDSLLRNTVEAIEDRIKDPFLGGVWRHEDSNVDFGDVQPWPASTLWLAEAYLLLGEVEKAWDCVNWVINNSSFCGLIPEHLAAKDIPVGISMPSFAQGVFLIALLRYVDFGKKKAILPHGLDYIEFMNLLKEGKTFDVRGKLRGRSDNA